MTTEFAATITPTVPDGVGYIAQFSVHHRVSSHANKREHWSARHARVRKERQALTWAWLMAGHPVPPRFPCRVTFTRVAPRYLDRGDNLPSAFKAMRDQLAVHLGLKDDAGDEVQWCYDQAKPRDLDLPGGTYLVIVRIEAAGSS